MDTPLSQTTNTLKLEEIKRRCAELSNQPLEVLELTLEDAEMISDGSDPYNRSSF
jgi:hypothetical protein